MTDLYFQRNPRFHRLGYGRKSWEKLLLSTMQPWHMRSIISAHNSGKRLCQQDTHGLAIDRFIKKISLSVLALHGFQF